MSPLPTAASQPGTSAAAAPGAPVGEAAEGERSGEARPAEPRSPDPRRHPRRLLPLAVAVIAALLCGAIGYRVGSSRSDGASAPTVGSLPAGPVDLGFAQDMIDHHDQAIQIASYAQLHATSPTVRNMAAAVIGSQRYEIGVFEQFLRDRGGSRGDPNRTVMSWMNMPVPHDRMPGLQPNQRIVEFLGTDGAEVDKTFLTLMIDHHEGGVHMAEYAATHAENPELRAMAARMVVDQRTEIGDYQSASQSLG